MPDDWPDLGASLSKATTWLWRRRGFGIAQDLAVGLHLVLYGNTPGDGVVDAVCRSCSRPVIERPGYDVKMLGFDGSS